MPPPDYPVFAPSSCNGITLVIDPGHGGEDGGAVSLSGALESNINLSVAVRLDQILGLYGSPVLLLRSDDRSLHSSDAESLREKKVSDLHNRAEAVNGLEDAVLLSIHQNSFTQPQYYGAQTFFSPTHGSSELACLVQDSLRDVLDHENHRVASPIPDSVYLLNHVQCPAVLVECGFLSNPAEDQLLQTPEYQVMIALALAGAYLQYQQLPKG